MSAGIAGDFMMLINQEAWSTMISCYDIIVFYDIIYDIMVLEDISGVPRSLELHVSCT